MKKQIFLFAICAAGTLNLMAQQQWVASFNSSGKGMDEAKAIVTDNAGNVYVTGYADMGETGFDYVTIKYNSGGAKQWMAVYNGPGDGSDIPSTIAVDNAGFVYVTGSSNRVHNSVFDNDAATIKYSPEGVKQWVARYDGALHREDAATALKIDKHGNVYITGLTTVGHSAYSNADYLTIKYNASGVQQWVATHNGPGNKGDVGISIGLDSMDNIYVTGTDFAGNDPLGEGDFFTIKYNPAGTVLWTARFNGATSETDAVSALAVDKAGNCYVTGTSRISGIDADYITVKYNRNGKQQWVASYGGKAGQGDISGAIALDDNGNVYVTGTDQKRPYDYDYRTLKYNTKGQLQWSARYNGQGYGNDYANALAVDAKGNVFVTGQSQGGIYYHWDIATVEYSPDGTQKHVVRYEGTKDSDDVAYAIALDNAGNVYVAGSATNKRTSIDFTTIKYSFPVTSPALVTQEKIIETTKKSFGITQLSPNPVNQSATIYYRIVKAGRTQLSVTDATGKPIAVLINAWLQPGSYTAQWNAQKYSAGIYYSSLVCGELKDVKKIMVRR